ncbi:MAG: zinc transporter permease subunit ZevB [Pasteurellaceae bacterium]|nr:zinc transporter permease subunit ZevB [Pasteurellaceae bacterium]
MKQINLILLLAFLIVAIIGLFPWLFQLVALWQREFNQMLSAHLHQIKTAPFYAGGGLILISFIYGIFHALGPGHGKFVITSYLTTHQTQLKSSMLLTFLASLMQGIVAITATSIVVVVLNLSSAYFKMSQLWLERGAYVLILLLGIQWLYQSIKQLKGLRHKPTLQIKHIQFDKTALQNSRVLMPLQRISPHNEHCDCGHQHLPSEAQLQQAQSVKDQLLIIISIGMRPCTGAIFVLFLAYMLDLYLWGIAATLAMAIGTSITLTGFAMLVQYARQTAQKLGKWYFSAHLKRQMNPLIKLLFGGLLILFAIGLIYGTTLSSGGATLFGR